MKPASKSDFNLASLDPARCAHLILDTQKRYCAAHPEIYMPLTTRINDHIAPELRARGVMTIWLWKYRKDGPPDPSYFCATPHPDDGQMGRFDSNGFSRSPLDPTLKNLGKDTIIISGFHYPYCVINTALGGARRKYNVLVLRDGTDYGIYGANKYEGPEWSGYIRDCGIIEVDSATVLTALSGHKTGESCKILPPDQFPSPT